MQDERLRDLPRDSEDGIERGHRFLKDHRDLIAADAPHLAFADLQEIDPFEANGAADDAAGGRRHQPQDRERCHTLAATTLTDHRTRLARLARVGHAVNGANDTVARKEMRLEIL